MVLFAHARCGGRVGGPGTPVLVAPRTIGGIRQSLPEGLRSAFDTDVHGAELPRLQSVLRFWRARAAARNDPNRLLMLERARNEL